jgi:hypothetical protein
MVSRFGPASRFTPTIEFKQEKLTNSRNRVRVSSNEAHDGACWNIAAAVWPAHCLISAKEKKQEGVA